MEHPGSLPCSQVNTIHFFKIHFNIIVTDLLKALSYLLTYGAEPFLRSRQLCSHSRTFQHFMEPEGSSPCSQEPSNGPYPEPDHIYPT
jgi:hypothetical protein